MSKQVNRDMLTDAIGKIDPEYLEDYEVTSTKLQAKSRSSTRYLRALLVSAACLILVAALLLCSLPIAYFVFRNPINHAVGEMIDRVIFFDEKENESYAPWVDWKLTDHLFDALGAGTEHSAIEDMKEGSGGLVGELTQGMGNYLDKLYQYYAMHQGQVGDVLEGEQAGTDATEGETVVDVDDTAPIPNVPDNISVHGVYLQLINAHTKDQAYVVTGMNGSWGEIHIPYDYYGVPVTKIDSQAFMNNQSLVTVVLGENIQEIGLKAFWGCSNLQFVEFSSNIKEIGEGAFANCTALERVEIASKELSLIGEKAFENCGRLQVVSLPDCPVSIGKMAFFACSSLEELELGAVTDIGSSAFWKCRLLKEIKLPDTLTEIGSSAFSGCESLWAVSMPAEGSLKTIGNGAFANCFLLQTVDLPYGLETIEYQAFYFCSSLQAVTIPATVSVIGDMAFYECKSMKSIVMQDGDADAVRLSIGAQAFMFCNAVEELVLPNTLRTINSEAFYSISGVHELKLPENVEWIDEFAIETCPNLERLVIQSSKTSYANNAIYNCPSLKEIEYCDTIESWNSISHAFSKNHDFVVFCTDGEYYLSGIKHE